MHVKNLWYCEFQRYDAKLWLCACALSPSSLKKSPCLMPTWTTHLCLAAGLSPLFFSSVLRVLVHLVVVLRRWENHMIIMSSRFYSQPLRRSHLQGASQLICNQGRFPGILKWEHFKMLCTPQPKQLVWKVYAGWQAQTRSSARSYGVFHFFASLCAGALADCSKHTARAFPFVCASIWG